MRLRYVVVIGRTEDHVVQLVRGNVHMRRVEVVTVTAPRRLPAPFPPRLVPQAVPPALRRGAVRFPGEVALGIPLTSARNSSSCPTLRCVVRAG